MTFNRDLHDNCRAVLRACVQTLPQGKFRFSENASFGLIGSKSITMVRSCSVYMCINSDDAKGKEKGISFFR